MIKSICHQCECDIELENEQQIPLCKKCVKEIVIEQPGRPSWIVRKCRLIKWSVLNFFASLYRATGRFLIVRMDVKEHARNPDGSIIWEVTQTAYYDIKHDAFFEMREHAVHYNFPIAVMLVWHLKKNYAKENREFRIEYLPKHLRLWTQ